MGHIKIKHTVLKGDVRETLPKLLDTIKDCISFALLDISFMNLQRLF